MTKGIAPWAPFPKYTADEPAWMTRDRRRIASIAETDAAAKSYATALKTLEDNPDMADVFVEKYGYLP